MKNRWIEPVTLSGLHVILEPLSLEHLEGIISAVKDGELWNLWFTSIPTPEKAEEYIKTALDMREMQEPCLSLSATRNRMPLLDAPVSFFYFSTGLR